MSGSGFPGCVRQGVVRWDIVGRLLFGGGPHLKMIHQRHLTDVEVQKEQIIFLSFENPIFEHFLHS